MKPDHALYILLAAIFVDLLAVAIIIPLLPFYARRLGADPSFFGLLGTIYGVCQLIGAPIAGRFADMYGRKKILMANFALAGISYLGTGLAPNLVVLFCCRIPVGLG
jgi:DHA1 family multidrug resistance protein-like MFS transporter